MTETEINIPITENKIRICLNAKDKEHLLKWKREIGWKGKDYYKESSNSIEVYFRSLKMKNDLERYYVTERKSFTTDFPDILPCVKAHFIRGVFDADGCITRAKRVNQKKSGRVYVAHGGEFSIEGSHNLIKKIQEEFIGIGLSKNSINYSGKKIFRVRYGGINQLRKIYCYLYDDSSVFLERKKSLFEDILNNYSFQLVNS